MPATTRPCTKCGLPTWERSRDQIADKLREAVAISQRERLDWTRRFQTLTAHLLWLEAELRGCCTNCVLQRASEAFAEARAGVEVEGARGGAGGAQGDGGPAEPGAPSGCRVIPLRRSLGVRFRRRDLLIPDPDGAT